MKTKILAAIMLLSIATSMLAFTMHISPANAANEHVSVYIDPPLVSEVPGHVDSFFDVFVTIDDVTDLFGFDIRVSWDNSLLTLDTTVKDAYLNTLWPTWEIAMEGPYGGGGGGGGGYKLVALSTSTSFTKDPGAQVLFAMHFKIIKSCNFILETPFYFDLVKLSDTGWQPILHTKTNGLYHMALTIPDLEFESFEPDSHPWEYSKTFQIRIKVTHICANLKDYNLVILYDTELLKLTDVSWTDGVLGGPSDGASYAELPLGTITVIDTGGIVWSGPTGLLFTLTFHVEFDDREEHIWHANPLYDHLHAFIKFTDATLSFEEGIIPKSGITIPSDLDIVVNLIRGDVGPVDGKVNAYQDLRCVAAFYDLSAPVKYDLTRDGTIDIFDLVAVATNIGYGGP